MKFWKYAKKKKQKNKKTKKKLGQHWHSHCNFSMNSMANSYFIFQISHAKTFKMWHTRCTQNLFKNIHKQLLNMLEYFFFTNLPIRGWCPKFASHYGRFMIISGNKHLLLNWNSNNHFGPFLLQLFLRFLALIFKVR